MAFLTLEDPRAAIKGSRDPLGVQPVWTHFGRRLVANLTTASTSVRGFTTLLLGRYFGEELVAQEKAKPEDCLDILLRMEQLSAYARHVGHGAGGEDIRGIVRVKAYITDNDRRVPIDLRGGVILSDQKVYGLWGLFSVPARTSGLIPDGPVGVTAETRAFIESQYLPILKPHLQTLYPMLLKGGFLDTRRKDGMLGALIAILRPDFSRPEQNFYGDMLRDGGTAPQDSQGRQERFRRLLQKSGVLGQPFGRTAMVALRRTAPKIDEEIAGVLDQILAIEALIAPAEALYAHLLTRSEARTETVSQDFLKKWGKKVPNIDRGSLEDQLPALEKKEIILLGIPKLMLDCAESLVNGDYASAVGQVIEWNRLVMAARGGGPWVVVGNEKQLDVRFHGQMQALPSKEELPWLWHNSYFIDALMSVTTQLERGR